MVEATTEGTTVIDAPEKLHDRLQSSTLGDAEDAVIRWKDTHVGWRVVAVEYRATQDLHNRNDGYAVYITAVRQPPT